MPNFFSLRKSLLALAVFAVVSVVASTAKADIVVTTGVNNQGTDNVLLNPATNVTTVTGVVGQNNLQVDFTSTSGSGLLNADPSGQATVSGGSGNNPLNQLSFFLHDGGSWTNTVFNINAINNGTVQIKVEGINITGGTFVQTFSVDMNGENFFSVRAINGQLITKISLLGLTGAPLFEDVRQVRLGGSAIVPTPEPTTMLLLGSGLLGVGATLRRRRKK